MSDIPPPYNHLQHLVECRLCFESDTRPNQQAQRLNSGSLIHEGRSRYFLSIHEPTGCRFQCLSNPGLCSGFLAVAGIPRGPRPAQDSVIVCPGKLCLHREKARQGSNSCHIGLCIACCVLAHVETSTLPPCPSHVAAWKKATNTVAVASLPLGTASTALPRAQNFAVPLSLTYKTRLLQLDNEHIEHVSSLADTSSFQRQAAKTVTVMWWSEACFLSLLSSRCNDAIDLQDAAEPDIMDISAPQHPYFHPAHSHDLITLYKVDTQPFEWFHPGHNIWKLSSINSPRQLVEKNVVFQFRNRGVRSGIGMSPGSILRLDVNNRIRAPEQLSAANSPVSHGSIFDIFNPTARPLISPLVFGSLATSPTSTSSSSTLESSSFDSPSPYRPLSAALNSLGPGSDSSPFNSNLQPPDNLPPLSSSLASSEPNSPGLSEAMLERIVTKAARGNSGTGWPFIYTRDMAAGFTLLDNRGGRAASRPQDFQAAFGCEYKNATYSDNRRLWDKACRTGSVDPNTIIAANDKTDTWRTFREKWR
ncbi:hypothetical protein B0H19DRAFT_1062287 [Mycena capillaripes]|nr:hypothetical protein B0H19DRAFT_1062287 [Mycena capillaripes]